MSPHVLDVFRINPTQGGDIRTCDAMATPPSSAVLPSGSYRTDGDNLMNYDSNCFGLDFLTRSSNCQWENGGYYCARFEEITVSYSPFKQLSMGILPSLHINPVINPVITPVFQPSFSAPFGPFLC